MTKGSKISVWTFMDECVRKLKTNGEYSTAMHYASTMRSLQSYYGGGELCFAQMTRELMGSYNDYLVRKGLQWNTISFYNRILRAVCNKARTAGITVAEDAFEGVYLKVATTKKRAVDGHIIAKIVGLDLEGKGTLSLTRDIFVFSYATQGMAFVDMIYLRQQDICGDTIQYVRRKTGQNIEVHLEPIVHAIINRYRRNGSQYIFPILDGQDAQQRYYQYRNYLTIYNRNLKRLAQLAKISCNLSSYVSRHSWASSALRNNVPVAVISQAMGHTSERTTRIYLSMLRSSEVAKANKKVLQELYRCLQ